MIKRLALLTLALFGLAVTTSLAANPPYTYWFWEGRVYGYVSGNDYADGWHLHWEACVNESEFGATPTFGCDDLHYVDDMLFSDNGPVTSTELGDTKLKLYGHSGIVNYYLTFSITDLTYSFNIQTGNMVITGGSWSLVLNQSSIPGYELYPSSGSITTSGTIPVSQVTYYNGSWYPEIFTMGCSGYLNLTGKIYYIRSGLSPGEDGGESEDLFDFLPAEDN